MRTEFRIALAVGLLSLSLGAWAHAFRCADVLVAHPHAAPSVEPHQVGAISFKRLRNEGRADERLIDARTAVAGRVVIHRMVSNGDVMTLQEVDAWPLPGTDAVSGRATLSARHHLMLVGLRQPLRDGDKFPLTLVFEHSGECHTEVWVEPLRVGEHAH
jgi:periplasmic copper chaperone A